MKIIAPTETLRDKLAIVAPITKVRTTLPILATVLLKAENGRVTIEANDLDKMLRVDVPGCEIKEDGACCVLPNRITQVLRDEASTNLTLKDQTLVVECGSAKAKILTLPPIEFVPAPEHEKPSIPLPDGFRDAIKRVSPAVYKLTERRPLMGVYIGDGGVVATDGKRCHWEYLECGIGPCTIPTESLPYVALFNGGSLASCDKNNFAVKCDGLYFVSRVLESAFPRWRQYADMAPPESFTVRREVIDDLMRCRAMNDRLGNAVSIHIEGDMMRLTSQSVGGDEVSFRHPCKSTHHADIAVSSSRLAEAMKQIQADEIKVEFEPSATGIALKLTEGNFTALVMTMRVAREEPKK